jgi:serine phosphatase RsbU (regulator of sigma subunit)
MQCVRDQQLSMTPPNDRIRPPTSIRQTVNGMSEPTSVTQDSMAVRSIMTAAPVAVPPVTPLCDVVALMRQRNIGAVIVADAGAPVGIFTERDLLHRVDPDSDASTRVPVRQVMTPDPWTVPADTPWQAALDVMQERGIRHAPVVEDGVLVGMLSVRDISMHRTALLESVIQQRTAELLQQKSVIEARDRERTHSLKVAARIQRQILPTDAPVFDPISIAFAFHPHDEVAGDYFDFQLADPDTMIVLIGDASGHGVPAAFISVIAKTCVHTRLSTTKSPAVLLSAMNELLHGWVEPEHFISMFVAAVDRRTLRMTYARAGHPLPLLLSANGTCRELDAGGIMIGVLPDPEYREQSVQLRPGDKVLFYTDGLPECPGPGGQLFGSKGLHEFLVAHRQTPCEQLIGQLVESVRSFSHSGHFLDDVTAVVLEVQAPRTH